MTQLDWSDFEPLLGSYASRIKPKFEEGMFDKTYATLKQRSIRGRRTAPDSDKVFYALQMTPLDSLKAVMVGMAPYHSDKRLRPSDKEGKKIADGLLMGASGHPDYFPVSLEMFYEGLEHEFKGRNKGWRSNDMCYLAYQGVLMWNLGLTVELHKTMSDNDLWEPFQEWFFNEIIGPTMVPVISLGDETHHCRKWLFPMQHFIPINHPVSASYNHSTWRTENAFTQVNKILKDTNGFNINWLPTKNEWEDIMSPF